MSNPKISVIVPVYNVEKYLSECLDSIVNQTLKDIEIICLNDGSTDNSLSILKEYASKDTRIILIDKENEGLGYTRKVGLDNATGKYILFCDSDDFYYELTAFEELYNYIEQVQVDVVIFEFIKYGKNNKFYKTNRDLFKDSPYKEVFSYLDIGLNTILAYRCFYTWNKLYSKKFLNSYDDWYFPKYITAQDVPLHIQIILRAKMAYINKIFYVYRMRNTSATHLITDRRLYDICTICKESHKILKEKLDTFDGFTFYNSFLKNNLQNYIIQKIDTVKEIIDLTKIIDSFNLFDVKDKEVFFFFRAGLRMTPENYMEYLNKKNLKTKIKEIAKLKEDKKTRDTRIKTLNDQIKTKNEQLQQKNEQIKNKDSAIKQKNNAIQNLSNQNKNLCEQNNIQDQAIKRLQNSWSYRIGRLFTYPLSIPLDFYKFIRNYNLIKKSGLFDSEYYLANNEDVKKAKADPLKHYLKFGWKEGRNPSAEFNGNEYLNKRPDVRVAGICPLVHYIKFSKEKE